MHSLEEVLIFNVLMLPQWIMYNKNDEGCYVKLQLRCTPNYA